jgi:hypothetical protein
MPSAPPKPKRKPTQRAGTGKTATPKPPKRSPIPSRLSDDDAADLATYLVTHHPLVWWESHGFISTKDSLEACLRQANILQQRLSDAVQYCLENKIPCRAVILKPRQKGISTITTAILYWMAHRYKIKCLIVGGKAKQWENLLAMVERYHNNDSFEWGFGGKVGAEDAHWDNGSILSTETAAGKEPGRSGTYQVIICTEVGGWAEAGVKNGKSVMTALMACMDYAPNTIFIAESTSSGAAGVFHDDLWQQAVDWDDFKRGIRKPGGFFRIFAGVFEFGIKDKLDPHEDPIAILAGEGARNEEEKKREAELIAQFNLDAEDIKYWRRLLAECANDPEKRDREYPPTPEDAFRAASMCRFNTGGIRQLRTEALHSMQTRVQMGMFDHHNDERSQTYNRSSRFTWRTVTAEDQANFYLFERPIPGCRYVLAVDNAGGRATSDDKRDTDNHAVVVLRCGYFKVLENGRHQWQPPTVVAAIKPGQKQDIDILTKWVYALHVFFGRCLVVPEANNDRGLIRDLRKLGVHIYEQLRPATRTDAAKPSGKLGFWTRGADGEQTRNAIIELIAAAIREIATQGDGIFIPFPWIVEELAHFRIDPDDGKAKGMDGWHDDWVLAIAIAYATKDGATTYTEETVNPARSRQMDQPITARAHGAHRV